MSDLLPLEEVIEILSKSMEKHESEMIEKTKLSNLTMKQMDYLDTIYHNENITLSEIADLLRLSKPSITAIINKFKKKGYLKKIQSNEDKRSFHLNLTKKGKEICELHHSIHKEYSIYFEKVLSKEELQLLIKLLNKVVKQFV